MSKELSGFTNKLRLNPDNTITKFFVNDNVTYRPAILRQFNESSSLRTFPFSPKVLAERPNEIRMTKINGETNLNDKVSCMNESLQVSLFKSAGEMLRFIHDYKKSKMPDFYVDRLLRDTLGRIDRVGQKLEMYSINPANLKSYFWNNCNKELIEKEGFGLIHGDYWLNNIIGEISRDFKLSGVIDWEMGGFDSSYSDFAVVDLSIEEVHPISIDSFWRGYGKKPDPFTKRYFSLRQIVLWISDDVNPNLESDFYKSKLDLLRKTI